MLRMRNTRNGAETLCSRHSKLLYADRLSLQTTGY